MSGSLYLLDGMALAYRAHFALIRNPVYTSGGFNTSAIFGFTATLIELMTNRRPDHLAVVFDTDAPTERHELHAEYKANREEMPEDLAAALPHLSRIAEAFDIPVLKRDGYEADDIIGTLAHRAIADGFDEVFMVTPDKDFGQLVTDSIKMYRPSRQGDGAEILGVEEVKKKWGIQRVEQVIDMLGLCGDSSDNIPGVPGIGPKTAEKLLASYDTVENLIEHAEELKGKQQERIREHAEQAHLSKKLATIQLDVPIEINWDDLRLRSPEPEKIAPLFAEFEFRTLGKRLFGSGFVASETPPDLVLRSEDDEQETNDNAASGATETPPPQALSLDKIHDLETSYAVADTAEKQNELVATLRSNGFFAFDTETTQLNPRHAQLIGISLATAPRKGWFVPIPRDAAERENVLARFRPVFTNPDITKIGHNLKFDLAILAEQGVHTRGSCHDTLLAHALLEPEQRHNLDKLAEDLLQYTPIPFSTVVPEVRKGETIDYTAVDPSLLADYAVEDADLALRLWQRFEPELESCGQDRVFYTIESPLLHVLVDMERAGIRMDEEALAETGRSLNDQLIELKEAVHAAAGREFNLNSPKQLGEVLFDELKLVEKPKKTKTGQYATSERILTTLAPRHPIVAQILEYRQLSKLKSTYVDALPQSVDPATGRIHTNFGQLQTSTGRLTSNDPNLQNIPVRSERGREIRKAFVPREGWRLLAADYSQIELRILAALTGDDGLLEAFRAGRDIHTTTAARIFRVPIESVTREQRGTAKMVNFGIPYGISAFGLAQRLGAVSRAEAQEIIDSYFAEFPAIPDYMEQVKAGARQNGYVETITGRRRYLRDINSANGTIRSAAERNAINMPIQGTAADMIKLAMIRIHRELAAQELNTRLLLQVHDELVFDLDPSEETAVRHLVSEGMRHALPLNCPIEVEIGAGENWLEAH